MKNEKTISNEQSGSHHLPAFILRHLGTQDLNYFVSWSLSPFTTLYPCNLVTL